MQRCILAAQPFDLTTVTLSLHSEGIIYGRTQHRHHFYACEWLACIMQMLASMYLHAWMTLAVNWLQTDLYIKVWLECCLSDILWRKLARHLHQNALSFVNTDTLNHIWNIIIFHEPHFYLYLHIKPGSICSKRMLHNRRRWGHADTVQLWGSLNPIEMEDTMTEPYNCEEMRRNIPWCNADTETCELSLASAGYWCVWFVSQSHFELSYILASSTKTAACQQQAICMRYCINAYML